MWGMIMGIRKNIMEKGAKIEDEVEGIMVGKVRQGEEKKVRQGEVRNSGNVRGREQRKDIGEMEEWESRREYRVEGMMTIIGRDFNARTDKVGIGVKEEKDGE